jgi:hypothetical protein
MRVRVLVVAAMLIATAVGRHAHACTIPPRALTTHHAELVRRAQKIALGRFEKATPVRVGGARAGYEAHFATIEVLKGPVGPRFSIVFGDEGPRDTLDTQPFTDPPGADFHGHIDWEFWDQRATREGNGADCAMHARFQRGATYLIVIDTDHWRAYERIDRPDDRWLRAVKTLIAAPSAPSGLTMSLAAYIGEQRALFLGEMVHCHVADDPDRPYPHEVKVREVLFGQVPDTVRIRSLIRGPTRCRPGQRVVGVVHSSGALPPNEGKPPARLFPLSYSGLVDFDAEPSEAVITRDRPVTLDQLRALAKARAGVPARR